MPAPFTVTGPEGPTYLDSLNDTAVHLHEHADAPQRLALPLGQSLVLALLPYAIDKEHVSLKSFGKQALIQRKTAAHPEGRLRVMYGQNEALCIVAYVAEYDNPLLRRGTVDIVVRPGERHNPPIVAYTNPDHDLAVTDIADSLEAAVMAARTLVDAALVDASLLPFSDYSARSRALIR